jgi:hypothetical protein
MGIGFVSWGLVADYPHLVLSPGSIMVRAKAGESMTSGIHCCPIFLFILPDWPLYCEEYVYTGYIHISDCVEIVYGLPLLQNNIASDTFFTNRERCEVLPGYLSLGLQKRKRNGTKCLSACSTKINLNVFTFNLVVNLALKSVRQIAC